MHARLPRHLVYGGRHYNLAGKASRRGTYRFMDPATGNVIETCFARVTQIRPDCFFTETEASGSLVRVGNITWTGTYPLQCGQILILGGIYSHDFGLRAAIAWPAAVAVSRQTPKHRSRGVVLEVSRNGESGRILTDDGRCVFVHRNQMRHGATLVYDFRVSFVHGNNGHGPTAYDVRPA